MFTLAVGWMAGKALLRVARQAFALPIVLTADDHDGREETWQRRPSAGVASWGIRGSGRPEDGIMWFDAFPGPSGFYHVQLGAVLERDGAPPYRVEVDGRLLGAGRYRHACGRLMCDVPRSACPDRATRLSIGVHHIARGARIAVWGRSVYPCGAHGAYARWYEVRFTPVDDPEQDSGRAGGK
ncbi:MAG: hypothetical protein D6826_10870 [Alphaproteobacteria bacterium]|nr:MAG: hypothetical protein D6826_10870 [Alphaproteobacteria bacterium]